VSGGFASQHGIISSGIKRMAAAEALEGLPATLQEAALINSFISAV